MHIQHKFSLVTLAVGLFTSPLLVAEPTSSVSFQGYAGYFNVPSAYTFDSGMVHLAYSNQTEFKPEFQRTIDYTDTHNFLAGVALWDYVEINARNAAYTRSVGGGSDLSANIKLVIPYIPENWFKLAVGVQDVGGEVGYFDSKYMVATKYFESLNVDFTLGYATSDSYFSRMDGVISAIRWQPLDWFALAAEYDGGSTNYGIELKTPKHLFNSGAQLYSKVLLGASEQALEDETFFNVGVKVPLTHTRKQITPSDLKIFEPPTAAEVNQTASLTSDYFNMLSKALSRRRFTDFKIGLAEADSRIVLEVDNSTYSTNVIDTYAVTLGLIAQYMPDSVTNFTVRVKQTGLVMSSVSGNLADYRLFLKGGALKLTSSGFDTSGSVNWLDEQSDFIFKPKITLFPHLSTGVGTDFGMFDYSVALASHVEVPLWKGAAVTALHLSQLTESKDYRDGGGLARNRQPDSSLQNLTFHQAFNLPLNTRVLFNYGRFSEDFIQTSVEADWSSASGAHRVSFYAGNYKYNGETHFGYDYNCLNDPTKYLIECAGQIADDEDRKVQVAKYRYYSSLLDTSFLAKYGQYWSGDKGLNLIVSHYFDDVEINLTFKATKPDGGVDALSGGYEYQDSYTKMVGLGFTVPLGPRKDYNSRYVNLRGRADWSYVVNTLVGERLNYITFGVADEARNFYNLSNHFNNFDKNGLAYIYNNQARLRSAFFELN